MNIKNMSIGELVILQNEINQEIKRRNEEQKAATWRKVREALTEYFDRYGEIRVETWDDTYYLKPSTDMSDYGVFNIEEG